MKPLKIYGDILGPQLCKVVLIVKELGLPYVLKVFDHSTVDKDPYAPTALSRAVPALDDPNNELVLWESGAIVEYIIETYDKDNKLHYTTFPQVWHQKQWAWHQFGGHEAILGKKAFISIRDYYDALIRGNLATIESHLGSTGNLYLIGDRVSYADLMFIAAKEASKITLTESFNQEFEFEWRSRWPRSYDWHQRLLQRYTVRQLFKERAKIIRERGWLQE
ncbi:related to theta class glutathione S-transferase [Ramularia collo-cygni]|uniref:Related to theta class glutathione S-transferase n=1 Tax=Ramularia collo-cygni TaxID=112498 RepID=A0A2D3VAU5_9PEZI|nr:related to theta class glutathione S-transferase [Ramularia collo-cygni]CZT20796.1 related to theta class glutathione S-transferase [Ramularia collo-cygni]